MCVCGGGGGGLGVGGLSSNDRTVCAVLWCIMSFGPIWYEMGSKFYLISLI